MFLPVALAITTFFSTTLGGLFAFYNRDRLHRILGFTAGVLLGVVAFDLFPEIIRLVNVTGIDSTYPMIAFAGGFLVFHVIEKLTLIHSAHEGEYEHHEGGHKHLIPQLGVISAVTLSAHSFFDGVGIGLAFQVNTKVGLAVAIAVIAHDFADGLNTVTFMLLNGNDRRKTFLLLMLDALTPILGAASTLLFHLSEKTLVIYLGFFVGFLMYIGASDILPEAHAKHPSRLTLLLTVSGTIFIFIVSRFTL
jgi:zinc transporter ZupT